MRCPVAGLYNDDVWGSMKAGPSQEEIRRHNLGTLLRHVHIGGSMSRAVLAERMGLNRSTILGLVSELGSAGLVREELPRETGRAGRPSLVVRPESDRVYVLAFDVGVDRLAAARIGLGVSSSTAGRSPCLPAVATPPRWPRSSPDPRWKW